MKEFIEKANTLIEALPYIREFYEKLVVIKYGGSAMLDPEVRRSALQDIVYMNYVGMRPVLVHGGGPFITARLDQMGKKARFVAGLRVTDEETMAVVEEELTRVNREIVREISELGCHAIALSGKDDRLIETEKHPDIDGTDIGFVGEVRRVNTQILEKMAEGDIIPVISPIGVGRDGSAYNVNADTAAAEIARSLRALKFVLLTDTDGILEDPKKPGTLIPSVKTTEVEKLIADKVIQGGMIPKVKACLRALDRGVRKAHIINGKVPHALLLEIFTDRGIGTEIVRCKGEGK